LNSFSLSAVNYWVGSGGNALWNNYLNWSDFAVPSSTTIVVIDDISNNVPHINIATASVGDLTIDNDAYIIFDAAGYTLDIYRDLDNNSSETEVFGSIGIVRFRGNANTTIESNNSSQRTIFNGLVLNKTVNSPGYTQTLRTVCWVRDYLELLNGTIITDDYLTLTSSYAGSPIVFHTAFLPPYNGSNTGISGDVIMQQSVVDNHKTWHWLSSPVANTMNNTWTLELLMDNTSNQNFNSSYSYPGGSPPDWVYYDERVQDPNWLGDEARYGWKGITDEDVEFDSLQAVCGSFIAGSNRMDWKGFPHNGTITSYELNYTNHGESADGINLVGNPYPWPLDWQSVWTREHVATSGDLGPMIWLWQNDGVTSTGGYFYIWDAQLYDNDPNPANWPSPGQYNNEDAYYKSNQYIAIGQGFEVQVAIDDITFNLEESDFTLGFSGAPEVAFIRQQAEENSLYLKLTGANNSDFLNIRWEKDVKPGFEFGKDGIKRFNPGNNLYSKDGGKGLMLERRPLANDGEIIPLHCDLLEAGFYNLSWTKKEFNSTVFEVYFEDKEKNLFVKVDGSFDYSFVGKKGKNDNRFYIHLMAKGQNSTMLGPNEPTLNYSNESLKIFSGKNQNSTEQVSLYKVDGRLEKNTTLNFEQGKAQWNTKIEPGTYLVKLGSNEEFSQKLIVIE
jgi:hypothetical protein